MPTIVVVVLAMLGLATFPQGGGKPSDTRPKAEAIAAGAPGPVEDRKDEKDLGPLATLWAADSRSTRQASVLNPQS